MYFYVHSGSCAQASRNLPSLATLMQRFLKKPLLRKQERLADGARGRSRTGTLLRAVDFLPTSAFAAGAFRRNAVRGLEHAFTVALRL
jgi:hypothetical protein